MLWLKPISPPDFAAELEKGLVLTWFSFSKCNFLPCFVTPETEAPLFFFLGNESQLNLLGARSGPPALVSSVDSFSGSAVPLGQ